MTIESSDQALLAQWIARWTSNPKVVGSSPTQGNFLSSKVSCHVQGDFWWIQLKSTIEILHVHLVDSSMSLFDRIYLI